jgi:hypothetical protein
MVLKSEKTGGFNHPSFRDESMPGSYHNQKSIAAKLLSDIDLI